MIISITKFYCSLGSLGSVSGPVLLFLECFFYLDHGFFIQSNLCLSYAVCIFTIISYQPSWFQVCFVWFSFLLIKEY